MVARGQVGHQDEIGDECVWPSAIKSTGLTIVVSTPLQEAAETRLKGRRWKCRLHVQCRQVALQEACRGIRKWP